MNKTEYKKGQKIQIEKTDDRGNVEILTVTIVSIFNRTVLLDTGDSFLAY